MLAVPMVSSEILREESEG